MENENRRWSRLEESELIDIIQLEKGKVRQGKQTNGAMNELLERHKGLLFSIVLRHDPNKKNFEDILSAARCGFFKALLKFERDKGKLSTFVYSRIKGEIIV